MKRMRILIYGLAAALLFAVGGCHRMVIIDQPYCAYREPVRHVTVYRSAPVVYSRVYVAPAVSYHHGYHHDCR